MSSPLNDTKLEGGGVDCRGVLARVELHFTEHRELSAFSALILLGGMCMQARQMFRVPFLMGRRASHEIRKIQGLVPHYHVQFLEIVLFSWRIRGSQIPCKLRKKFSWSFWVGRPPPLSGCLRVQLEERLGEPMGLDSEPFLKPIERANSIQGQP